MHSSIFISALAATGALAAPALNARQASSSAPAASGTASARTPSRTNANNQDIIEKLTLAATVVDRTELLPNANDHVFDFLNPNDPAAVTTGNGGHTVKADRKGFPALIGTGVSMTVGFLGPCGFNTPHTHPRSSEFNIVVQGTLDTEFIYENGAAPVKNTLNTLQATVFPSGAVHTEFNPGCDQAIFVAGFGNEDPGVQQTAQTFYGLDDQFVAPALNGNENIPGADVEKFRAVIPKNVAVGIDACLARCGIQKNQ